MKNHSLAVLLSLIFQMRCQSYGTKVVTAHSPPQEKRNCNLQISESIRWSSRQVIYAGFDKFEIYPEKKGDNREKYRIRIERIPQSHDLNALYVLSLISLFVIPYWQNDIHDARIQVFESSKKDAVIAEYLVSYDEIFWIFTLPWAVQNESRLIKQLSSVFDRHCLENGG